MSNQPLRRSQRNKRGPTASMYIDDDNLFENFVCNRNNANNRQRFIFQILFFKIYMIFLFIY